MSKYKGNKEWCLFEILEHHSGLMESHNTRETRLMENVHHVDAKFVAWNHNPQPVNWVQILYNRIREWHDHPHPFLNFA